MDKLIIAKSLFLIGLCFMIHYQKLQEKNNKIFKFAIFITTADIIKFILEYFKLPKFIRSFSNLNYIFILSIIIDIGFILFLIITKIKEEKITVKIITQEEFEKKLISEPYVNFTNCDLSNLQINKKCLINAHFTDCIFYNTNFDLSNMSEVTFKNCEISNSSFDCTNLECANFINCCIDSISMRTKQN